MEANVLKRNPNTSTTTKKIQQGEMIKPLWEEGLWEF
jgi:hypothetical protein